MKGWKLFLYKYREQWEVDKSLNMNYTNYRQISMLWKTPKNTICELSSRSRKVLEKSSRWCYAKKVLDVLWQKFSMVLYVLNAVAHFQQKIKNALHSWCKWCELRILNKSFSPLSKLSSTTWGCVNLISRKYPECCKLCSTWGIRTNTDKSFENSKNTCVLIIDYDRLSKLCYH